MVRRVSEVVLLVLMLMTRAVECLVPTSGSPTNVPMTSPGDPTAAAAPTTVPIKGPTSVPTPIPKTDVPPTLIPTLGTADIPDQAPISFPKCKNKDTASLGINCVQVAQLSWCQADLSGLNPILKGSQGWQYCPIQCNDCQRAAESDGDSSSLRVVLIILVVVVVLLLCCCAVWLVAFFRTREKTLRAASVAAALPAASMQLNDLKRNVSLDFSIPIVKVSNDVCNSLFYHLKLILLLSANSLNNHKQINRTIAAVAAVS